MKSEICFNYVQMSETWRVRCAAIATNGHPLAEWRAA